MCFVGEGTAIIIDIICITLYVVNKWRQKEGAEIKRQ